jgi:KUP system potassium uptake protein
MVLLATLAAVIASQAVISGAFSLARQAIQLGYLPRLQLVHTSAETIGQVFLPWVNRILLILVMRWCCCFQTSSNLASAYGVSVTGSMLIDTILLIILASNRWRISPWIIWPVGIVFLTVDIALLSANARSSSRAPGSRSRSASRLHRDAHLAPRPRPGARARQPRQPAHRALRAERDPGPAGARERHRDLHDALQRLHAAGAAAQPQAQQGAARAQRAAERGDAQRAARGGGRARRLQRPRPRLLAPEPALRLHGRPERAQRAQALEHPGPAFDPMDTTFFASREALSARKDEGMALWRDKLFLFMSRNATPATEYFGIPGNRLVELGTQVVI